MFYYVYAVALVALRSLLRFVNFFHFVIFVLSDMFIVFFMLFFLLLRAFFSLFLFISTGGWYLLRAIPFPLKGQRESPPRRACVSVFCFFRTRRRKILQRQKGKAASKAMFTPSPLPNRQEGFAPERVRAPERPANLRGRWAVFLRFSCAPILTECKVYLRLNN